MIRNLSVGEYFGKQLKSIDHSFFKLSSTCNDHNTKTERHYHTNDYVSILSVGKYYEKNKSTSLVKTGDIVFRPSDYVHENRFDAFKNTCFNIEFKSDWRQHLDLNLSLPSAYSHYKSGSFPLLYKLLYNFLTCYNEDHAYELLCNWIFQINSNAKTFKHKGWTEKVIRILEKEHDVFHSLKELSDRVFVHPAYLARAFKEKTGRTIGEYQLSVKISNATDLLLKTSLSITDISQRNGFYDDAHFINTFKSVYSISPHQFRLSIKK